MQNENKQTLSLVDNHFGDPTNGGHGYDVSLLDPQHFELLSRYSGKLLNQWLEPGVLVFPDTPNGVKDLDDESAKLAFFTIESNQEGTKRWINTGNCMGVVKLRNQITGASVQIGIGSRFPKSLF